MNGHTRRDVMKAGLAGLAVPSPTSADEPKQTPARPFLTPEDRFRDVSRGSPLPHTLKGDALVAARLTPETWRLEIVADESAKVAKTFSLKDENAIDLQTLQKMGKTLGVKFLKAMQCLNINQPLGQGLWEGVPLRDVLGLCGKLNNVRRIFYHGFHNNDPKQIFRSSLSYTQVMEATPGELPVFIAYKLNGEPLSLERGGPVRMVVPWAYGFKSIKWLHRITFTNDYKINDTYAEQNNDPDSPMKTAAYVDVPAKKYATGSKVAIRGVAVAGLSGLKSIEYWLRSYEGEPKELAEDDEAWAKAEWKPCRIDDPPTDWKAALPAGMSSKEILGFDPKTGKPATWPLRYSTVSWSALLEGLKPGKYEVRARAVDLNGIAQPEPRPYQKSGKNPIEVRRFEVAE